MVGIVRQRGPALAGCQSQRAGRCRRAESPGPASGGHWSPDACSRSCWKGTSRSAPAPAANAHTGGVLGGGFAAGKLGGRAELSPASSRSERTCAIILWWAGRDGAFRRRQLVDAQCDPYRLDTDGEQSHCSNSESEKPGHGVASHTPASQQ